MFLAVGLEYKRLGLLMSAEVARTVTREFSTCQDSRMNVLKCVKNEGINVSEQTRRKKDAKKVVKKG